VHLGYQVGTVFSAENYTRATLPDQLNRYAYAGVAAVLSLGTDPGALPFQIRQDQKAGRAGGARLLTAGRGIAAPNAGPGTPELKASAYGVAGFGGAFVVAWSLTALLIRQAPRWRLVACIMRAFGCV